ncbi:MAG: response regulator, partial [Lentisphaeria bacterium]|nr:response regulator [Lentisphaeria bacterium]
RSMFFSIVSHDIRTPLNAILGYSELLQNGVKTQSERDEALQSIRESGTTLLQLVNDVLDLAKLDSGKMSLHPEPVLLSKLTDDVFASFRLAAGGKGIELVNWTADVPKVMLDEHRFRQLLFNLIGNAVKFTESGSVTVSASYAGNKLDVAVSDTGCGIPEDMLKRIMDPFVQVQDPSHAADRAGGTGLGLSICRSLVETMGGQLLVESKVGKGSTFRIRIPDIAVCEEKKKPAAAPKPAALPVNRPEHVLIVDDSPVNRAVLAAFLKKAGITSIDQARDGGEAFAKLDSAEKSGQPHDFVLSDLWMPNMNGMELIEKLRGDSRFKDLPVFALTADTEYRRDARNYLFSGILLKPLTYDKLMDVFAAGTPG